MKPKPNPVLFSIAVLIALPFVAAFVFGRSIKRGFVRSTPVKANTQEAK